MQIALQDIRKWGNLKIMTAFYKEFDSQDDFFSKVYNYNSQFSDIKVSAYSIPKKWKTLSDDSKQINEGIKLLMFDCEPMIELIDVDEICQRKFRNKWERIWKNIGEDLKIPKGTTMCLADLGLKLLFIEQENLTEDLYNISKVYTYLLKWSVFTQSELSFAKNEMSFLELIESMIVADNDIFLSVIDSLI